MLFMKPKTENLDAERSRHLRRALLLENNGAPEKQKDELVNEILLAFGEPEYWPMTDADRCNLLRKWYSMARKIRETETA